MPSVAIPSWFWRMKLYLTSGGWSTWEPQNRTSLPCQAQQRGANWCIRLHQIAKLQISQFTAGMYSAMYFHREGSGGAVSWGTAQQPEGRLFDPGWGHWDSSLTYFFRPHYGLGVDSASNRNQYQEYLLGGKGGRCAGLTTLSPASAIVWIFWQPLTSWSPKARSGCIVFVVTVYTVNKALHPLLARHHYTTH